MVMLPEPLVFMVSHSFNVLSPDAERTVAPSGDHAHAPHFFQ